MNIEERYKNMVDKSDLLRTSDYYFSADELLDKIKAFSNLRYCHIYIGYSVNDMTWHVSISKFGQEPYSTNRYKDVKMALLEGIMLISQDKIWKKGRWTKK